MSVWLLFFLFIEHLGEEELAIANIVWSISEVPFVFFTAFASTAATLVSNIIGILKSSIAVCWTADGIYSLCIWIQCVVYIHGGKWRKKGSIDG